MRKFFAILVALVLAFTVGILYSAQKQAIPFKELNLKKIGQILRDFKKDDQKREKEDKEPIIEIIPEGDESLSYVERLEKGNYFFERGFLTFAVNEYVKAASVEPKRPEPYLKLLETYFALGDYEKAKRNAETLLLLDPASNEVRYWLIQIHLKQGAFPEAKALLDELRALAVSDPQLDYSQALLDLSENRYESAKKLLKEASSKPSLLPSLKENIDRLLGAFQEFEFAQAAETLYLDELLARALNQNKEYELAVFKLKAILKTRADLRDSWILLGFSYLNLGEYYFALTSFQRAYELDSEWPATQYFLGLTYKELKDSNQAITYFNYALKNQFEPRVVILRQLADLYLETKDYETAVKTYRAVLDLSDGDVNSFVRPIWLYLDLLEKPEEALKLAELAIVSFPNNAMAYNLLGWSQSRNGDFREAEKNLKKALELDPNLVGAHYNLGKLYEAGGNLNDALKAYEKAYTLDQSGSLGRLAAERYNALMK